MPISVPVLLQLMPSHCAGETSGYDQGDVFTSTAIPSLSSALIASSNHTLSCSGRIHSSAVYHAPSHSVLVFGGMDLTGVVCEGSVVMIDLDLRNEGAEVGSGSGLGELSLTSGLGSDGRDCSSVQVLIIDSNGGSMSTPAGRYLHTANVVQVSSLCTVAPYP